MVALKELFKNPTAFDLELASKYASMKRTGQRDRNFEAFAATGLPSRRVEAWKFSDLRNALLSGVEAGGTLPLDPFESFDSCLVLHFRDGALKTGSPLPDGIRLLEQKDGQALGGAEEAPVAALGAALADSPGAVLIEVSKSVSLPVRLKFESTDQTSFSRVAFVVRAGCKLDVLESHLAAGGFSSRVVEYSLEHGAEVRRTVFQNADVNAVQVFTCLAHLSDEAKFVQAGLGFGAKLCRNETRIFQQGGAAEATLNAAYLVGARRHYDLTSFVRHSHAGCTTRQLCKGAVSDEGRSVFQGKFFVARQAQQTDAEMVHHALILEDGGEVNAKPELEIYADDVQCAHGNTVGSLDGQALFYMRQRGISEKEARALLTQAFINETFDGLDERIAETFVAVVNEWLESQS